MEPKNLLSYASLGGVLISLVLVIATFGYTYIQAQKVIALTHDLNATQSKLAESNLEIELLKGQLRESEGDGTENGTTVGFELKGEVYGPISDTKIGDNVIDDSNIVDHSIGESEVNSSEVQLRVVDECPEGYYVKSIDENGHVSCGKPSSDSSSSGTSGNLDLEEVLLNGNDANNRDITGVDELEADKVSTNRLCLNGDCKSNWPSGSSSSGTPGLSDVLSEDNDAGNSDIKGVNNLYAQSVCLNNDCKNQWDQLDSSYRTFTAGTNQINEHRKINIGDKDDYDICAINEINRPRSSTNYYCKVYVDINNKWVIEIYNVQTCKAICLKLNLN